MHEVIQSYMERHYVPYLDEMKESLFLYGNEHYGEVDYYSAMILLKHFNLSDTDHFLDIGSGFGKMVLQTFLTTPVASATGIEINVQRCGISNKVSSAIQSHLPELFTQKRVLALIPGDFLEHSLERTTVIYVCSFVFSFELLDALGKKISMMPHVKQVASLRKLPHMTQFKIKKRIYLYCTWDKVPCYLYERLSSS